MEIKKIKYLGLLDKDLLQLNDAFLLNLDNFQISLCNLGSISCRVIRVNYRKTYEDLNEQVRNIL